MITLQWRHSGMAAALLIAASAIVQAAPVNAGEVDHCAASEDVAGIATTLPHVAAALRSDGHPAAGKLSVLAVGSATMFGPEQSLASGTVTSQALAPAQTISPPPVGAIINAAPSERSFPMQMARDVMEQVPGVTVTVTVRGGRGLTAADMLAMIRTELSTGSFQLVIWQTGTVEAVRNLPTGDFAETLSEGAALVQAAGADLVLVDPQYSRFLQTNANLDPYANALQQAADLPGVLLFHRYDLMRSWVSDGLIDLERTPRADRQKAIVTLHACLGMHLARMLLAAARS